MPYQAFLHYVVHDQESAISFVQRVTVLRKVVWRMEKDIHTEIKITKALESLKQLLKHQQGVNF